VLVRAVAASMASGEVTRPVAASRPAMQGPSQDHRALVVGRARGAHPPCPPPPSAASAAGSAIEALVNNISSACGSSMRYR
jgi:hypothetical protein